MRKTKMWLIMGILFLPLYLTGGNQSGSSEMKIPKRFKVGDMYYASSFRGMKLFMADLEAEDPALHNIVLPEFNKLKQKRTNTLVTWGVSGAIGTTLIVGGFTFLREKDEFYKPGDPFYDPHATRENAAAIFTGMGVYIVGGIISLFTFPKEEDLYNLINTYNKNSPNQKMDWQIGIDLSQHQTLGLKITLNL